MTKPRVLIPSDNDDFVLNLASGYSQCGFDVVAGRINFELEAGEFDIVHILWPEELSEWAVPSATRLEAIIDKFDRWHRKAHTIISVNNLIPHHYARSSVFDRLYTEFYKRADVIHHFSNISREFVCREYPGIAGKNHVTYVGFNYSRLLTSKPIDRDQARAHYSLKRDDLAFLVFGALRSWEEVLLLREAFNAARIPNKKLLLASQYGEEGPRLRQRWRRLRWDRWRRARDVYAFPGRIPEEDLPFLFSAADAVVVVRKGSMNSGLPSLAMTFGRFLIAPNFGSMAEYLDGTDNALYTPSSPSDLARALEYAARADREHVGHKNAELAAKWDWKEIIQTCLDGLPRQKRWRTQQNSQLIPSHLRGA